MQLDPGGTRLEVPVAGGTLTAQRLGDGEVALLLHGGPGISEHLGELAAELRSGGVATLRYQQRGVPPSTVDGPFDVEQHAADAIAVLDAAETERAWLVGHSWGGYLALQVATRAPRRVRGVLAIGTLGAFGDGGAAQLGPTILSRLDDAVRAEVAEIESREEAGTATEEDAVRGFALIWPGYFGDPAAAPPPPGDVRLSERCFAETLASIERDAERLAAAIASCPVPVVFLHGAIDPIDLEGSARAPAAALPRADIIVVPEVGHFPWLERPGSAAAAFAALRSASEAHLGR
jgi:pimeloyl-ACP methyl ester carboxylesterase